MIEKVKSFTERQSDRRRKTTGVSASIRNLLGLRNTPALQSLRSYPTFTENPDSTLTTLLHQFHQKSGRHFSLLDIQAIILRDSQNYPNIQLLHKKLQQRRQGKRYLLDQKQIDPAWSLPRMRTYLETIIEIQRPFNEWIAIYIRIGHKQSMFI